MLHLPTLRNTELTQMNANYYSGRFKKYFLITKLRYKPIHRSYFTHLRRVFTKLGVLFNI